MATKTNIRLTFRSMLPTERETVIALWHACGLTRPWNDPARDLDFAAAKPNSDILVGFDGDVIVASVMVGHDGHRGTVYYLSVTPERHGEGLGRQAMAAAEDWLKAHNVWKINLMVRNDNESVRGFYREIGYQAESVAVLSRWLQKPDADPSSIYEPKAKPDPQETT